MFRNFILLTLFVCLQAPDAPAQQIEPDSIKVLKEFTIEAPRVSAFSPGLKTTRFDSVTLAQYGQQNLSDLLAGESPIFMKSYGLGSLASSSFRGGGAFHTAVVWNGISINNPINGQLDLALIPLSTSDQVRIQYGGGSVLFGSGAISGIVHLINNPEFNKGNTAEINLQAGSYEDFRENVNLQISKSRIVSSLKLANTNARNNFPYRNAFSSVDTLVHQSNAALNSQSVISENKFKINRYQTLSLNAWIQNTNREIPPTMLQQQSRASQRDLALRITPEWKIEHKKQIIFVRAAWLREKLIYADPDASLEETTNTEQFVAEAETKIQVSKNHLVNAGLHYTYSTASHLNYPTNPRQNREAAFASWLFSSNNNLFNASISARAELLNKDFVPFTYSAGTNYRIWKWLNWRANFSKNYRIPTFNDLYWVPGGNPNLKPEEGLAGETGLELNSGGKMLKYSAEATVFTRNTENWIMWLPGAWLWGPQNIMHVWSRGLETSQTITLYSGKTTMSLTIMTSYVRSTNTKSKVENDNSVNRQLIYTPMYSGSGKLSVFYKKLAFSYRHNYIGYRYTSSDNTQFLEPFDLGSIHFAYSFNIPSGILGLQCQVHNIWNEAYQVISNRPMPGINFNFGIQLLFRNTGNQPSSNK